MLVLTSSLNCEPREEQEEGSEEEEEEEEEWEEEVVMQSQPHLPDPGLVTRRAERLLWQRSLPR